MPELTDLTSLVGAIFANRYQTQAGKRLKFHAELREQLLAVPEALREMDQLLAAETKAFVVSERQLLERRFDSRPFVLGIFFALLTLLATMYALLWIVQSWGNWWTILICLGGGTLIGAALGSTVVLFRAAFWVPQTAAQP